MLNDRISFPSPSSTASFTARAFAQPVVDDDAFRRILARVDELLALRPVGRLDLL